MRGAMISAMSVLSLSVLACSEKKPEQTTEPVQKAPPPQEAAKPSGDRSGLDRVLAGLAASKNSCPDIYDYFPNGGMRIFWCHVETILPYRSLTELAKQSIYLSGPHTADSLKLDAENSFGNYNPKFVDWMVDSVVPEKIDSAIYDKFLREKAQLYARAYKQLEKNGPYIAAEREYLTNYLREPKGTRPIDRHAELAPEDWPNEYSPAMAFWIRRHADGTAPRFYAGLQKLMKVHDAEYLASLEQADLSIRGPGANEPGGVPLKFPNDTISGAIKNIATELGSFSPHLGCRDEYEYEPGGLRTQACRAFAIVTYEKLQAMLPMPIYLKGPHSKTALNLTDDRSFGHYNPSFVKWLSSTALPISADPAVRKLSQPIYNEYGRIPARAFYYAKRFLDDDAANKKKLIDEYARWVAKPSEDPHPRYAYWGTFPEMRVWEAQAIAGTGVAFWIRRTIDGTDRDFEHGLKQLLKTYDGAWFAKAEKTRVGDVAEQLEVWFPPPAGYDQPLTDDGP